MGFTPICLLNTAYTTADGLCGKLQSCREALFNLLSLTLKIFAIFMKLSQESVVTQKKIELIDHLKKVVNTWIKNVIGGRLFGCEVRWNIRDRAYCLLKDREELNVHNIYITFYLWGFTIGMGPFYYNGMPSRTYW